MVLEMKLSTIRDYFFPTIKAVNVIGDLQIFSQHGVEHFTCTKRKGFWKKAKKYNNMEFAVKNKTTNEFWVLGYYNDVNPMLTHETLDEYVAHPFNAFIYKLERISWNTQ
jgi:hypothetical protein